MLWAISGHISRHFLAGEGLQGWLLAFETESLREKGTRQSSFAEKPDGLAEASIERLRGTDILYVGLPEGPSAQIL